jgi:hypothetical protein
MLGKAGGYLRLQELWLADPGSHAGIFEKFVAMQENLEMVWSQVRREATCKTALVEDYAYISRADLLLKYAPDTVQEIVERKYMEGAYMNDPEAPGDKSADLFWCLVKTPVPQTQRGASMKQGCTAPF